MAVSDFHGAYIEVIQSKNPSLVGHKGIVMKETENTLVIISVDNRLRTLLKADCIFNLYVDEHYPLFVLHGQHLCYRTALRSKVKIKSKPTIQLK